MSGASAGEPPTDPLDAIDPGGDLWEIHAEWWQDGFTERADAEYTEQILPLAAGDLAGAPGARRRHRRGADRPAGAWPTARPGGRHRSDLGAGRGGEFAAAEPCTPVRGGAALPFAAGGSTPSSPAWCSNTSPTPTLPSARWPACCAPVAASPSSSTTRCCRHPAADGSTTRLDPPEQYWRIGPYLTEDHTHRGGRPGVFIPFVHRPLGRYLNALADAGLILRHVDEPAPPPWLPGLAAPSTWRRPPSHGFLVPGHREGTPMTHPPSVGPEPDRCSCSRPARATATSSGVGCRPGIGARVNVADTPFWLGPPLARRSTTGAPSSAGRHICRRCLCAVPGGRWWTVVARLGRLVRWPERSRRLGSCGCWCCRPRSSSAPEPGTSSATRPSARLWWRSSGAAGGRIRRPSSSATSTASATRWCGPSSPSLASAPASPPGGSSGRSASDPDLPPPDGP